MEDTKSKVLALSKSQLWNEAQLEWRHDTYCSADIPDKCICGAETEYAFPLVNTANGNRLFLGSCCIRTVRNRETVLGLCSACNTPGVHRQCYYRVRDKRLREKIEEIESIVKRLELGESAGKFANSLLIQLRAGKALSSRQLEAWRKIVIRRSRVVENTGGKLETDISDNSASANTHTSTSGA